MKPLKWFKGAVRKFFGVGNSGTYKISQEIHGDRFNKYRTYAEAPTEDAAKRLFKEANVG